MDISSDLTARADLPARPDLPDEVVASTAEAVVARWRRWALASCLLLGPWFIVASNTLSSLSMQNDGEDLTPKGALAVAAAHPTLERWAGLTALVGSLLLVPASVGLMNLVRVGAARLGWIGGVLMAAGYVCYFALVFQGFNAGAMVRAGGSAANHEAILQELLDEPMLLWVPLLFVLGNIVGTFLVGLALVRSRRVPRWAGYAVLGWPVLHVIGLPWSEVAGAVLQAVGLAVAALVLLGASTERPDDATAPYELLRR